MAAIYHIVVSDPSGQRRALLTEFSGMSYTIKLNDVGNAQFNLPMDSRLMQDYFTDDSIIEIQRAVPNKGIDWYTDYTGLHRTPQKQITEAGNEFFTSYSRTLNDLLRRCWIPYVPGSFTPRGENGFSKKLGPADDVMKAIVRENVGPDVGAQRLIYYAGIAMPNFSVQADTSQAEEWGGSFAYENVLKTLQQIGIARSVDFNVIRTVAFPVQFSFITAYPLLGTDRSVGANRVIFSKEFGNVKTITYTKSATDEVTAALVLGQGLEDDRSYAAGYGTRLSASPYNRCEIIKDARNQDDEDLAAEVEEILRLSAADESFQFTALQDSQFLYGRDYFLGDRVLVKYDDVTRSKRLVGVTVKLSETGEESIDLEFSEYIAQQVSFESVIRSIAQRLMRLEHKVDI